MTHHVGGRPLFHRAVLALLVLLAGMLALLATSATAAVQTQTWTGQDGGATPDIYRSDIDSIFRPDGTEVTLGQAGTINLTLDGTPVIAFCVDPSSGLDLGTVQSDVQPIAPDTVGARAIIYVLLNAVQTGAPTPEKSHGAAVGQIAMWVLDGDLRESAPTSDAALNADVATLLAAARAAAATPASLGLSAGTPAAGSATAPITVTGRPGAAVTLSIASGAGSLSATQVTIGAGGTATVTLTSTGPGTVTVAAATAGDGDAFRIMPGNATQETAYARPTTLSASTSVAFQAAPVTPTTPARPSTPIVPIAGAPSKLVLRIAKTAPARAQVLRLVRYRITVTNPTRRAATGVVVRDRIPAGLTFVRASRSASVRGGAVVVRIGRLAPGAKRSFSIWMRATANVRGVRTNVASVSGGNVRNRSVAARTAFRPLAVRVQPAVTG